ncbi:sigma-54-dependent Fis family transcriptional regulator [bacterium]|nr:sigma-54-dependent Fis family transcriptional regulator [bacterium]
MTESSLSTIILESLQAGWIFLDQDLRIVQFNSLFQTWHPHYQTFDKLSVTEVLPETVGLDLLFKELISGKQTAFTLSHIEKESLKKETGYFNLIFLSTKIPEKPILILLFNDTDFALIVQKVQQQSYEIKLMRSLLHTKTAMASGLIGSSEPINRLRNMIEKVASVPYSTILIQGETGTGKSLVAYMIHHLTDKRDRPFIEFNCAAVPETLLESELFGYEKGAFTHAAALKKGLLEEANGGTLFLDEIGDVPINLQSKLLTVLESRKFRRLGSTRETTSKFRLIAATNRNLKIMLEKNKFREDLFYRIQVVTINCPPLRDLGDDLISIAQHFIQNYNREFGKAVKNLTPEARHKLKHYDWPGNVRELRNVIERAMIFSEGPNLGAEDIQLPQKPGQEIANGDVSLPEKGLSFEELEKGLLRQALERSSGNQSQAARLLNMSRDTFRYRLEKYNMLESS